MSIYVYSTSLRRRANNYESWPLGRRKNLWLDRAECRRGGSDSSALRYSRVFVFQQSADGVEYVITFSKCAVNAIDKICTYYVRVK